MSALNSFQTSKSGQVLAFPQIPKIWPVAGGGSASPGAFFKTFAVLPVWPLRFVLGLWRKTGFKVRVLLQPSDECPDCGGSGVVGPHGGPFCGYCCCTEGRSLLHLDASEIDLMPTSGVYDELPF